MNRFVLAFAFFVLALFSTGCDSRNPLAANPSKEVMDGNQKFAWELYGKLREKEGNLFFSPISISTALAMTSTGAKGETLKEMLETLHLPEGNDTHAGLGGLLSNLTASDLKKNGYEVSVANALWGQKSYSFKQEFLDATKKNYGAGLNPVDFAGATEESRKTINAWVEKQTREKIRDLLAPGVLTGNTRLVLTNAIYFKGNWSLQFDPKLTLQQAFTLSDGKTVTVPMMHQNGTFRFFDGDGLKAIELPYQGDSLSMLIFLPKKHDGLSELEKELTGEKVDQWVNKMTSVKEMPVAIPKFKIEAKFGLTETLAALGMKLPFDQKQADFSGMDGSRELFISDVIHQAFVEVNEEGTEAAAATAVVAATRSEVKKDPPSFIADHPFAFVIRDRKTNTVLFAGRVVNPK